jgi:hypothetical protein
LLTIASAVPRIGVPPFVFVRKKATPVPYAHYRGAFHVRRNSRDAVSRIDLLWPDSGWRCR